MNVHILVNTLKETLIFRVSVHCEQDLYAALRAYTNLPLDRLWSCYRQHYKDLVRKIPVTNEGVAIIP